MIDAVSIGSLVVVSILWGFTNPLMKKASVGIEDVKRNNRIAQFLAEVKFLLFNWRYISAFILNQLGSVLYYWTLGSNELSTTVIVSNSLTLVFTTLSGQLLGEQRESTLTYVGMAFVTLGVSVCIWSKS
ncbi:hypothetical protein CHUAL_012330 [Chamberlinius hualienensis]